MNNQPRVQKKNKKAKLSGFTLFVIEYNKRTVKEGQDTSIQKREIDRASPRWNQLSPTKQEEYKARAKQLNVKIVNTYDRFNTLGEKLDEVEERKRQLEEAKHNRRCEIEQMLKLSSEMAELDSQVFYLVAASKFYDDSDGIYPAEFAMAKFSLVRGVFETLSLKISPGQLPMGSALEVKEIAATTHKYDLNDERDPGEGDYITVLTQIIKFMHPFDDIPVLFTEGNDDVPADSKTLEDTKRIVKVIFEEAGEYQIASELKVYSIDELLFYLKNTLVGIAQEIDRECEDVPFTSIFEANLKFKKVSSEYSFRVKGCDYHTRVDALPHCCLAKVRGFGYTLAKWCATGDKYALKPGHHYPETMQVHENNSSLRIYR